MKPRLASSRWPRSGMYEMPRELIEPHKGDKRYVGATQAVADKQVETGRSLAADRRSKAKTIAKNGEGDRGRSPPLFKMRDGGITDSVLF